MNTNEPDTGNAICFNKQSIRDTSAFFHECEMSNRCLVHRLNPITNRYAYTQKNANKGIMSSTSNSRKIVNPSLNDSEIVRDVPVMIS